MSINQLFNTRLTRYKTFERENIILWIPVNGPRSRWKIELAEAIKEGYSVQAFIYLDIGWMSFLICCTYRISLSHPDPKMPLKPLSCISKCPKRIQQTRTSHDLQINSSFVQGCSVYWHSSIACIILIRYNVLRWILHIVYLVQLHTLLCNMLGL